MTTGLSQAVKVFVGFASIVFIARLLSPEEYGIAAMVAPVTAFVLLFQNLGLNQAVVQVKTLSPEHTNALFWINIGASIVIAAVLLAIAPLVGWFYEDLRPAYLTAATAATIVVTGLNRQHMALMNRNMEFTRLSMLDVLAAVVTFAATLAAAYSLRSFWALWIGAFVGALFNTALVWFLSPWRPSFRVSFAGTRGMLVFGANLTGFNIVNFFARNLDTVLIARAWGATAVGLYDRSYKLMMFPLQNINQPLGRVMLPALSRANNDPKRYRRMFLLSITALSLVSVPGVMVAAMLSDVVISVLLGPRWTEAAPIFLWLSIAAIGQPINNATGWLFISSGRTREMMYWGFFSSAAMVAAFVIGLPWGPVGVAAAYACVQVAIIPPLYVWCTRGTPMTAADLYAAMLPTLAGGLLTWPIVHHLRGVLDHIPLLIGALVICYLLSVACQLATPSGRTAVKTLIAMSRDAVRPS
jgi:PST family polysaccharide transporter